MGVSENRGTPKSSILMGFSILNHPFWGAPIFGNIQMGSLHHQTVPTIKTFRLQLWIGERKHPKWTSCLVNQNIYILYLDPQTTIYKWLFQFDDFKSLHRKWVVHQTSILSWLFGVPCIYIAIVLLFVSASLSYSTPLINTVQVPGLTSQCRC